MFPISGSSPPPEYRPPAANEPKEKHDGTAKDDSEASSQEAHTQGESSSSTNRIPFAADNAELAQALRMRDVHAATAPQQESPPPNRTRQIADINSVIEHGILTKRRSIHLEITPLQSADHNEALDTVCLNYIYGKEGIDDSLLHVAKGGLTVALERKNDPLIARIWALMRAMKSLDRATLNTLSERAHHSALFIVHCRQEGKEPDRVMLKLLPTIGEGFDDSIKLIPHPDIQCQEIHVGHSIAPENIAYVIVPDQLEPYRGKLNVDSDKLIFVSSKEEKVPFYIGGSMKVKIQVPDYDEALKTLLIESNSQIFTHMMRTPTSQEPG